MVYNNLQEEKCESLLNESTNIQEVEALLSIFHKIRNIKHKRICLEDVCDISFGIETTENKAFIIEENNC